MGRIQQDVRPYGPRGVFVAHSLQHEKRLPQGRLAVVSYVIVGMIALLLFGFWKLQIIDSDRYAQMAERNRVRSIPIIAPRGSMLDREGRVLVDNYPSFSVLLLRDAPEQVEKLLPQIADGLGMTLDEVKQQIDASRAMPKFQPIVIKPEASPSDIAFIESHRADIPVLEMLMVHRRRYPHGDMLASAIGYVGEVSAEQVEASDSKLKPGDTVGKSGPGATVQRHLDGHRWHAARDCQQHRQGSGPPRTAGRHSREADPIDD